MTKYSSYNNDPAFKLRFVRQTDAHRRADRVLQGTYGVLHDGKWRGCAVACSLRSIDLIDGKRPGESARVYEDHETLAQRLGIPITLTHLEDRIFDWLPRERALEWPGAFARAIPVGRDLSLVWPRFAIWLLTDSKHGVMQYARNDAQRRAIGGVTALYAREVAGDKPTAEEFRAARYSAARAAAYAARAAAYAATAAHAAAATAADAQAADAADAQAADAQAADAAQAAAQAAAAAAYSAKARRNWFVAAADKLIELMAGTAA